MTSNATKICGLVLAGGKSVRMGHDKSVINWHGKEQRYYIADLLKELCDEVYISCREEQVAEIEEGYKTITDNAEGKGPVVGILSAQAYNNDVAWLVVACDLPLMDDAALKYLICKRDTTKVATTYKSPHDGLPEPLITIWEPRSKEVLLSFRDAGYNCPRKALINSNSLIVEPLDENVLINANTPEDAEQVKQLLAAKTKQRDE